MWTQPKSIQRHFELKSGTDVYATLTWQKAFGSLALGRFAGEEITLKRGGFIRPYVSVRSAPKGQDVALLRMGFGGNGELQLADGRKYTLQKLSFWKAQWGLTAWNGMLLFRIHEKRGILKHTAEVKLDSLLGGPSPNLTKLLVISWYAVMLIRQEQAAAST